MDGRRMRQIFQTASSRLERGERTPPESYPDDEKELYNDFVREIEENRKNGVTANYDFPNDYD